MEDEAFLVMYLVIHADKTDNPYYDFHHLLATVWYTNNIMGSFNLLHDVLFLGVFAPRCNSRRKFPPFLKC